MTLSGNGYLPDYCELCGGRTNLSKHRVTPGCEGGKYGRLNTIRLCREPCHNLADSGFYRREALYAIISVRNQKWEVLPPGLANGHGVTE